MTSEHSVSKKEPLVHISKRDRISFGKAWGIRIIAVLISLVVCALVIVALTKLNPLEVYRSIADGAVGTERRLWVTIRDTMILLCIAVGLTPAFKMRFWNIGAEGQILAGAAAAAACYDLWRRFDEQWCVTGCDVFSRTCRRFSLGSDPGSI